MQVHAGYTYRPRIHVHAPSQAAPSAVPANKAQVHGANGMAKASVNRKAPASARSPGARTFGTNHYDRVRPARPWRELGVPPEQS